MLKLILGRSGCGKTHTIRKMILEKVQKNEEKILLLVPEQSSFDNERAILNLVGERFNNHVLITNFKKLTEYVFEKTGKLPGKRINDGDKAILMSLAIDKASKKLKIYNKFSSKTELIEVMLSASNEFKMCNVTNAALSETTYKVDDITLREKLNDASIILSCYNSLLQGKYLDPLDELTQVYKALCKKNIFAGYSIFVDGFDGFTAQQLLILERFVINARECFISLCTDDISLNLDSVELFAPVNKTMSQILNIARKNGINTLAPVILDKSYRISEEINKLEKNFLRAKKEKIENKCTDILIYSAKNQYDEVGFLAKMIRKMVMVEGYRYKDFLIIARNENLYEGIIEACFEKFEIPLRFDKKEKIDSKPLVVLIFTLLEIVKSNFSSENIFKYLKIGLLDFSYDEISDLENYVLLWSITNNAWKTEFCENPRGISETMTDDDRAQLERFNSMRKKIMDPLLAFAKNIQKTDGKGISQEIYKFLEGLKENLISFSEKLSLSGNDKLASEQVKIWDLIMDILDQMAFLLAGTPVTIDKYLQLFKLIVKYSDIGSVPAKLDEVTFGAADRIRTEPAKVVFVLGANDGEFPRHPVPSGIFSDDERCKLLELGVNLYSSLEGISVNERFLAYKAVSASSEKLFISFTNSTIAGGYKRPSLIVTELKDIFPSVQICDESLFDAREEIWAYQPTFELCAKYFRNNSVFSHTLRSYFLNYGSKEKIKALEKAALNKSIGFEDASSAHLLFDDKLRFSASQIEKYYLCPFQFFCKYGLAAKPREKVKFDSLEYGNLMHFVLENTLQNYNPNQILNFSKKELEKIILDILDKYVSLKLGSWKNKTARFRYLFSRLVKAAVPLIFHIASELAQSEFTPVDFELSISKNGKIPPLRLKLPDSETFVEVEGKIDRVDVMKKGKTSYVRIVDYKTGVKDFKLSDILYGLNLQMLVYMLVLSKSGVGAYRNMVPCGILYMPSKKPTVSANRNTESDRLELQKMKKLRMNGIILESSEVVYGMEKEAKGIFIPASVKNNQLQKSESLVNAEYMGKILKYIEQLVIKMAENLKNGKISAKPVKGQYDACEYCEYASACGFKDGDAFVQVDSYQKETIIKFLEEGIE